MNSKFFGLAAIAFAGLAFAFAGCSSQSGSPALPAGFAPASIKHQTGANGWLAVSSCQTCAQYKNEPGAELFYAGRMQTARRDVTNGIAAPWVGLLFDTAGDLFVANCTTCLTGASGINNVVEIKPHRNTPAVTITNGITYPYDLVIDSYGTLYASNLGGYCPSCNGSVSEYSQGYTSGPPAASITVKYPLGMAIDSHQNLYVANCAVCSSGIEGSDQILVYPHGSTTPSETITTGINEPVTLAIDSADNLYVANCLNCGLGAGAYISGSDTVTEYAYGGTTPVKTITFGTTPDVPFSLAVDASDDLFVGNVAVNSVTEYPPNATQPSKTFTNGVSSPVGLAESAVGNLFVSNAGANTVTMYRPTQRSGAPSKTISVSYPSSIAVSP